METEQVRKVVRTNNLQCIFPKFNHIRLEKPDFTVILDSVRGVRSFLCRANLLPMEHNSFMKTLSFAAAVCLTAFPVLYTVADDEPVRTIPELTLEERIVDLLETIEDEAPAIYHRMAVLPREEALARIMRALDSGVVPASAAPGAGKTSPAIGAGQVRQYPVFGLTDRMFPYLRFDALTREHAEKAVNELNKLTGEKAPAGMIFDLRETDGGENESLNTLADSARKLKCPVMVLISGKTKGTGELLAAVLRRDCGAVLIGTETAGSIFPVKRITVNDVAWFVPTPPPEYAGISPYALKPDLEKISEVRMSYDELKEKPNRLDGDPVLRLAADLLTMKAAVKPVEQTPAQ